MKDKLMRLVMGGDIPYDCYLLGCVLMAVFLGAVSFVIGKPLSPWIFWVSVISTCVFVRSPKHIIVLLGCLLILLILTAYTFSYTGVDAVLYHVPTQLLLKKGWNPVFVSTWESFVAAVENVAWFRPYHVLFLPHFNAMCGAIVALGAGLWVGDSFLNYLLLIVLFNVARRFSKQIWGSSFGASLTFAVAITFSPNVTSFLAGQVDYVIYSTFFIACFAGYLAFKEGRRRYFFLLFSAVTIGALAKNNGIFSGGFVCLGCFWPMRRNKMFWLGLVVAAAYFLIVGVSPYLTNWHNYGSPFYPNHTFRSGVELIDLTEDFVGNADAESMGYLSRIAYAWISPAFTVRLLSVLHGRMFSPEFYVAGGVAGCGSYFRVALLLAVVALVFSKKSFITVLCVGIFVLSNFAPLKYIGYERYFVWIWGIPILSFYHFAYKHYSCWFFSRRFIWAGCRVIALSLSVLLVVRGAHFFLRFMAYESVRQQRIREASERSKIWYVRAPQYTYESLKHVDKIYGEYGLVLRDRLRIAGVSVRDRGTQTPGAQDLELLGHEGSEIFPRFEGDGGGTKLVARRFPLFSGVKALIEFDWVGLFKGLPRPLMDISD